MTVAVIGAGIIGSAIVKSLLQSGYKGKIIATRRRLEAIRNFEKLGVDITDDNKKAAKEADIIVLCVKPKDIEKVLEEIQNEIEGKLVISVAAALDLDFLAKAAPKARFVRAMPNIAILVRESFTAYSVGSNVNREDRDRTKKLLSVFGKTAEIDERLMDAMTALSGCAPAYLSVILEAMNHAGSEAGLPRELALVASAQSMIGVGKLVLEAHKTPLEIRDMVATPGGVTVEGLRELGKVPIEHAFIRAIEAAVEKSKKMSRSLTEKGVDCGS